MTDDLQTHVPRRLEALVHEGLRASRVVAVCGARQVGKSSLARHFANESRPYVTLDDLGVLDRATRDPQGLIAGLPTHAILDEVQRAPKLLLAIKSIVDQHETRGRFLLTGSSNLLTLPSISESLAGRMFVYELYPLAEAEIARTDGNMIDALFDSRTRWPNRPFDRRDFVARLVRGGYPEAVRAENDRVRAMWFESYLLTMLQRDIRELARIEDTVAMGRLLGTIAMRSGRILNATNLASEAEITKTTLLRYLALLEQTYLVYRVSAWAGDPARRLSKAPKILANDTGLAAHQLGAGATRLLEDPNLLGGLTETFVGNELRKHASWSDLRPTLLHYRSHEGAEVDFILETRSGERVAVEVKAAGTVGGSDFRGLLKLADDPKMRVRRGVLFYAGSTVIPARENVHAVPISLFWTSLAHLR
ncbi:ATP-binding protein [bacterium]|nr:MAG: ATP-binding protein [bacterium]